ncbi:MAG TPA: DUF6691 family protein [Rhodothermales bacterium]
MSYAIQEYATEERADHVRLAHLALYFVLGILFGIILTKSEVVSWFRIQEMFRFQSVHMYGVIGSAIVVAAISLRVIDRLNLAPTVDGHSMLGRERRAMGFRHAGGGLLFGFGWALTGACPGPIYTLIGSGATVMVVVLISALAGAWTYGHLRPRLPH